MPLARFLWLLWSLQKGLVHMDVIALLKNDHKMVKQLFKEFAGLSGNRTAQRKTALVEQIRHALTVHAQLEEDFVYPAFKEHRTMKDLVSEALEEHHVVRMFLSELHEIQPDDEQYDAKVKVLNEYLMHHVREEEKEIFPQAEKRVSAARLAALGEEVETRRSELMGEGQDRKEADVEVDKQEKKLKRDARRAA